MAQTIWAQNTNAVVTTKGINRGILGLLAVFIFDPPALISEQSDNRPFSGPHSALAKSPCYGAHSAITKI